MADRLRRVRVRSRRCIVTTIDLVSSVRYTQQQMSRNQGVVKSSTVTGFGGRGLGGGGGG